jgi:hypothetical protein
MWRQTLRVPMENRLFTTLRHLRSQSEFPTTNLKQVICPRHCVEMQSRSESDALCQSLLNEQSTQYTGATLC